MNDAEIRLKINIDEAGANKQIKSLGDKVQDLSKKFRDTGKKLTIGLTLPIVGFGVAAVNSAMELESTEAKFNTVFGKMADDVDGFIKEFKKLSPITQAQGRVLISGIQDMLVPLGFAREEATAMSKEFMHLAGALSSFGDKSVTVEQTMGAMQSALAGSMEPLRSLGIVTSAAEIEMKAMNMTGKKTTKEINRQEKAAAILAIAYENSTDALEAYKKENIDLDTELKIMTADFKDQMALLGRELMPLLSRLVGVLTRVTAWIGSLNENQRRMIWIVAGMIAVIGPLLMLLGSIVPAIQAIGAVIAFLASPIGLIVLAVVALVGAFVYLMATSEDFRKAMYSIFNAVWGYISPVVNQIMRIFGGLIRVIKGAVLIIGGLLNGDMKMVMRGFENLFKGIGNVVSSAFNLVLIALEKFVGLALMPINALIDGLNLVPGVDIKKVKLTLPKIPKLATGTNYTHEGLHYLHDGEAVVPKKYNPAAGGMGGGGMMTLHIQQPNIEMNGRVVSRELTPYITQMVKLGGGNV